MASAKMQDITAMENQHSFMSKSIQNRPRNCALLLLATLSASFALPCAGALAHGFGERYDLPLPLPLFIKTAGQVVALSFLLMAVFVKRVPKEIRYPKVPLKNHIIGRIVTSRPVRLTCQVFSIVLFLMVIASGYFGVQDSIQNLSVVTVWIIAWVGLAYVSALVGNVWVLINPWSILFCLFKKLSPNHRIYLYPKSFGTWPAVTLFLLFAWMEIAWGGSSLPRNIAVALTIYSAITWAGMFFFGRKTWLQYGEAFSVVFSLFSRFSIIEDTDSKQSASPATTVFLRPPIVGLQIDKPQSFSMVAFVLLLLSTVTYDGFAETALWQIAAQAFSEYFTPIASFVSGIGMILFAVIFIATYMIFIAAMALIVGQKDKILKLAGLFVFSVVPIAIAYHLSHYLSLLLTDGQLIISRISDPFGFGWNLFGTAHYQIELGLIGAATIWYSSIIAIIIGHIAAIYLAHTTALQEFEGNKKAILSQVPMVILMIGYTMISLWIIAQPIVA
jgi:hypothetical protein